MGDACGCAWIVAASFNPTDVHILQIPLNTLTKLKKNNLLKQTSSTPSPFHCLSIRTAQSRPSGIIIDILPAAT